MSKILSLNFYAQPGAGKSTGAAYVFSYLKNRGYNVELIREYPKDVVYRRATHLLNNQVDIFSEQFKRMKEVADYGKVPMVITDCPLMLGTIYADGFYYAEQLKSLVKTISDTEFSNVNVLVRRVKPYNPSGRNQNEVESDALGRKIETLARAEGLDYEIDGDEAGQKLLAELIIARFGDRIRI